jgi:Ca2+-transporting ATPase
MRSRRQSIFSLKGQNMWLWGAFLVAFLLTFLVIEIPFLANMFSFTVLDLPHYGMALGLAILIIPIMEVYKAIMRAVDKSKAKA